MKKIIISLLMLSFVCGCVCKKKTEKCAKNKTMTENVKPATIDRSFMNIPETVDYTIKSASIENHILTVELTYKGGSGNHDFSLMFNGMYKKSYPLKVKLFIKHDIENETKEKEITEVLKFDLKPVQSPGGEPMIITIHGYQETFNYEY